MKDIVVGILAHVDAGKTTLSEGLLYVSGSIRKIGRVDHKDAFLDTDALERARGITIFSKQARLNWNDSNITLLDTPGHVDFSAEMERTLQVLDYGILVISGADGVQGHTHTLWRLLDRYRIPVFLFINKMDQAGTDREQLIKELKDKLDDGCVDFTEAGSLGFYDEIAMCDEKALERFLESDSVDDDTIRELVGARKLFPCFFGSALKLDGVEKFLDGLEQYTRSPVYQEAFGARVYKIARDSQGVRMTYLKVTGGSLKVRDSIRGGREHGESWEEKVTQIRLYSGDKYETLSEVLAGSICAVTGLTKTVPGEGLGCEEGRTHPVLTPVLTYRMDLPLGCDLESMVTKLRQLEEEEPELHIVWNERLRELQVQIMGEVQIEILKNRIADRFGVQVQFGTGNIVYKETIRDTVEGIGHFEPLRHYAEVHLLLEPGKPGSGLTVESLCAEDKLDRNWQRLILTHLEEKEHCGVLTGSQVTDLKITLMSGKAHVKHTEGGDFRQATYRAVRQGLMQADSLLLEPWYEFLLELPEHNVGRAMTDIENMHGTFSPPRQEHGLTVLTGSAPVAAMRGYQRELAAYTKGYGRLTCEVKGYEPCHNADEVIRRIGYVAERDTDNPAESVFCAHGAGFVVPWNQVKEYMHLESCLAIQEKTESETGTFPPSLSSSQEEWIGEEEVEEILNRTYGANRRDKSGTGKAGWAKRARSVRTVTAADLEAKTRIREEKSSAQEHYLLVDGYNIIYAWEDLRQLAEINMDGARVRLMDILCNYQAVALCRLIVVFDAYRVKGHVEESLNYHNIHVVYTKEAETADQFIEKFAHENARKYQVTVATSDGLEQIIIRGQGCGLVSAKELEGLVKTMNEKLRSDYLEQKPEGRHYLSEHLPDVGVDDGA